MVFFLPLLFIIPITVASVTTYAVLDEKLDTESSDCDYTNKKFIELGWENFLRQKQDDTKKFPKISMWQTIIWFLLMCILAIRYASITLNIFNAGSINRYFVICIWQQYHTCVQAHSAIKPHLYSSWRKATT